MKYIDAEKLKTEIERRAKFHDDAMKACIGLNNIAITHSAGWKEDTELLTIIDSLQHEMPDKETILRICKLHKAWSIMAPWDNVEDFVTTNWNSENIV